jgi:hypothetical protein
MKSIHLQKFFQGVAIVLLLTLALKSFVDINTAWDYSAYHLPFAAQIWNIVPESSYRFADDLEARFDGFPLLANFLQGLFWQMFHKVEATNLVNFLAFCAYLFIVKSFFNVPAWASSISLLAVPMVQIHVTGSLTDLFCNLGASVLIMMTYKLYLQTAEQYDFQRWRTVPLALIAAACAANSKLQIMPVIFLILVFAISRIVYLEILVTKINLQPWKKILIKALVCGIALPVIFATGIKNTVLYGNPAYPVEASFLGHSLNHLEASMTGHIPDYLVNAPNSKAWIYSVFEVNAFDPNRYLPWTEDQGYLAEGSKSKGWRMGGYFAPYVVFHLILLGYFLKRYWKQREVKYGLALMIIITMFTSILPQSHQLRYYMYWIICLISINLFFVFSHARLERFSPNKRFSPSGIVGVCFLFLVCAISLTKAQYVIPKFYSLEEHLSSIIKPSIISQINSGDEVCIVGQRPHTFFYAAKFHRPRNYLIYEAQNIQNCKSFRPIL